MAITGGYLADSFTRILIPDFAFTFSVFTFVGEALLILWLFGRAIKGFASEAHTAGVPVTKARPEQPTILAP